MPTSLADVFPGLSEKVFDNSFLEYLLAAMTFVVIWFFLVYLRRRLVKYLERLSQKMSNTAVGYIVRILASFKTNVLIIVAIYIATRRLIMAKWLDNGISHLTAFVVIFQITLLVSRAVDHFVQNYRFGRNDDDISLASARANLSAILRFGVWIAGFLFLLSNLGINVTTFITGLGIGGIAIALAAQTVLGDVFSSFTIAIDKPFEVGDFIVVDSFKGTIEQIGLKTTRIRSLDGELLVIANSDLTKSRIQNFKRMDTRRINFKFGVTYDTDQKVLREIPTILKSIIESIPKAKFDRAHFMNFTDSSLSFEVVYLVESRDYIDYADVQQEINLRILEQFGKHRITFAFPSTTQSVKTQTLGSGTTQKSP